MKVFADVQLSEELNDYFKRIIKERYGEGGHFDERRSQEKIFEDRKYIDQKIDADETFTPYKLVNIINLLDTGLLENFYNMDWSLAMQKVHDALSNKKAEYLSQKRNKIDELRYNLQIAKEIELDEIDVQEIKDELAKELKNAREHSGVFSNNRFLQLAIGSISPAGQLTSSATPKQISSPTEGSETDKE